MVHVYVLSSSCFVRNVLLVQSFQKCFCEVTMLLMCVFCSHANCPRCSVTSTCHITVSMYRIIFLSIPAIHVIALPFSVFTALNSILHTWYLSCFVGDVPLVNVSTNRQGAYIISSQVTFQSILHITM